MYRTCKQLNCGSRSEGKKKQKKQKRSRLERSASDLPARRKINSREGLALQRTGRKEGSEANVTFLHM